MKSRQVTVRGKRSGKRGLTTWTGMRVASNALLLRKLRIEHVHAHTHTRPTPCVSL